MQNPDLVDHGKYIALEFDTAQQFDNLIMVLCGQQQLIIRKQLRTLVDMVHTFIINKVFPHEIKNIPLTEDNLYVEDVDMLLEAVQTYAQSCNTCRVIHRETNFGSLHNARNYFANWNQV